MTPSTQTAQDVLDKVIEIISEQMGRDPSEIDRDSTFVADLGMDSLDLVEVIMECEDTFEIDIPDEEQERIRSVGQATDYIVVRLGST